MGKTGALWRIHWSVCLPSLACDFFRLTPTEGPGTGGQLIVRVNTGALGLRTTQGEPFDLLAAVSSLKRAGAIRSWTTQVVINDDRAQPARTVPGRVCALRKSAAAIKLAHRKVHQEAARRGKRTQADTLRFAEYVIVFTTFPAATFSAAEIPEWYRLRWQMELVFKRFKSLAQLGHLPNYDDDSAKAWWARRLDRSWCATLTIVVYSFNMLGDALRDLLDPRLRGSAGRTAWRASCISRTTTCSAKCSPRRPRRPAEVAWFKHRRVAREPILTAAEVAEATGPDSCP